MRLRELKRRTSRRVEEAKTDALMIQTGMTSPDEVRRRRGGPELTYDEAVKRMLNSPRAEVKNTNEWRVAQAHNFRKVRSLYRPTMGDNPLALLITFLRLIGPYVDPKASLSANEQCAARIPPPLIVEQWFKCQLALPGVPQDHLERAMVYVERRMELVAGDSHRARRNRDWLGRWQRAICGELERRALYGDLPPPPVRDGMKLTWSEIERSRVEFEQMPPMPPMQFERLPPMAHLGDEIQIPEIRTGPTITYPTQFNMDDI